MGTDIITIDGPSAAGKSTLARGLASALGWSFLDTGAIYRAVAVAALENGLVGGAPAALGELARRLAIRVETSGSRSRVFIGEREVTDLIRTERVSKAASQTSSVPEVRLALVDIQIRIGKAGRLVGEGRDLGTAIFPDARLKFFLTATPEERAKRRFLELVKIDPAVKLEDVLTQIQERDHADVTREMTPLRQAQDAILLNSTSLSLEEALKFMEDKAREVFSDIL
jgi:cytidylate kinase